MNKNWEMANLGSVADITMGQSPESSTHNKEGLGLPFLQGCAEFDVQYPNSETYCHPPLRVAKKDSVLISVRAPVGKMNWCDQNYCIGRGLGSLKAKSGVANTFFLKHALDQNIDFLHQRSQGSTFLAISLNDLKLFPIPDIPKKKQEKIATIINCIDSTIEKTEVLIHKYQQIKSGLMHVLFTRGVTADGKLRPPREQSPELYKETPIGWIPRAWNYDSISLVMESLVDGPFGSNLKTEHYVIDPGVRVVRLQNIQATVYNDVDKAYVSEKHANYLIRNKVVSGDILIAGLGEDRYPTGRACQYPKDLPSAINKADCFRLRCKATEADNSFVMFYLNSPNARLQIRRYEQGVTRLRINLGNMKKIVVPKPHLQEQKTIVKRLSSIELTIERELMWKAKLEEEKKGLMHDLLTGSVQVKIDIEEPEHV